jgi:hypothetical protein
MLRMVSTLRRGLRIAFFQIRRNNCMEILSRHPPFVAQDADVFRRPQRILP